MHVRSAQTMSRTHRLTTWLFSNTVDSRRTKTNLDSKPLVNILPDAANGSPDQFHAIEAASGDVKDERPSAEGTEHVQTNDKEAPAHVNS